MTATNQPAGGGVERQDVTLLERGPVFADLARSVAAAKRGVPRVVAVIGSPGVGKTAVLEEFCREASLSHHLLVRSTYRQGDVGAEAIHEAILELTNDPWAAQFDGVEKLANRLGSGDTLTLGQFDRIGDRHAGNLIEVVLMLSTQRLVLLVLDDLHWQGDSGWSLLERLVRAAAYRVDRGERLHLHVCLAFRDGECEERWAQVVAQGPTVNVTSVLTLEPLSELAVNQLLRQNLTSGVGGDLVAAVLQRSAGNPLYVHQLCRGLRRAQLRVPRSSLASSLVKQDLSGVSDLRKFASEEMARSTRVIRLAVAAAALSGAPLPAADLGIVVASVSGNAFDVWREADATGLIRLRNGRAEPVHGVFGDVAGELLDIEDRALLHAALARHWLEADAPPWVVARHACNAGGLFDPQWVAQQCAAAALAGLGLGDYSMATDFGAHAIQHAAGLTRDELLQLHHIVSLSSFRSHDPARAEEAVSVALRFARSVGDADNEARLLSILARVRLTFDPRYRDPPEIVGFLATSPELPSSLASRLQEDLAEFAILRNDTDIAARRVARCVALAEDSTDPLALAPAYFAQGLDRWVALDLPPAIAAFHASSRAAQNGNDPWFEVWGDGRLALVHLMLGELDAARRAGDRTIALAERVHDWSEHSLAASVLTAAAFAGGDLARASEIGELTLALVARSEYIWGARSIFPMLAHIGALAGSTEKVQDLLQRWEASGVGVPPAHAAGVLCELGRLDEAAEFIDPTRPWRRSPTALSLGTLCAHATCCIALDLTDVMPSVIEALERARRYRVVLPCDSIELLPRLLGELYLANGQLGKARLALQNAGAVARRQRLVPERGRTQLALAKLLKAEGAPDSVILRQLNIAAETLDHLGLAATVDQTLRLAPELSRLAPSRRVGDPAGLLQRTLLITDMVSSTHVNATLGDLRWLELIDAHDRLIRGVLEAHGGREFSHTGDGLAAWFADPTAAAAAARDLQERFAKRRARGTTAPVHIRIGIATGRPLDHDSRVLGVDVARATRITAAAGPEEVYLDQATAAALDQRSFPTEFACEAELRGLPGRHRLDRLVLAERLIVEQW